MSVADKIKKYRDSKGIKKKKFELLCGLSNGYLDKIKTPGSDILENILKKCPDLNREWVHSRSDEMLNLPKEYSIINGDLKIFEEGKKDTSPSCEGCINRDATINSLNKYILHLEKMNKELGGDINQSRPRGNGCARAG